MSKWEDPKWRNSYMREWRERNPDKSKESSRLWRANNKPKVRALATERKRRTREQIEHIKRTTPCADCREVFDPVCMDFDHLDSNNKVASVADMTRDKLSLDRILAEISKCDVVCANCHRIRTRNRGYWDPTV